MVPLSSVFPEPITRLPQAELPFPGARAYVSQAPDHQLLYMEFSQDVELPAHAHAAQWGIVLEGEIRLTIGGAEAVYHRGERYFIPAGVEHSGHIYAGYADLTFFAQKDRYRVQDFRPIVTDRLVLRRFAARDAEPFWRYRTDAEVAEYQGEVSSYTPERAAAFAQEQSVQACDVPGTWFQVAIALASTGELIGDCGLHTLRDCPDQVELGITIARRHQGRGYAREAVAAVLDHVFGPLGKHRAIALTDPGNAACIRLLESLGMRKEAHFVKHLQVGGAWVDDLQYALLAEEWKPRTAR